MQTRRGGKTHLVALAVVLQAAGSFAVAAFAVPAVRLALFAFANFRFEGFWVPVETRLRKTQFHLHSSTWQEETRSNNTGHKPRPYLYSFEAFGFMFQVVEAVIAVTVIAELSICKAVTVSGEGKQRTAQ